MNTIGTCGNCGGPVEVPDLWAGVGNPPAKCASCGARPRHNHGPRIEMEPPDHDGRYREALQRVAGKIAKP